MRSYRMSVMSLLAILSVPVFAAVPSQLKGTNVVDGKPLAVDTQSGTTVVVFLSSKCPCSASHEPVLSKLAEEFGAKGVRFVGVNSNADETIEQAKGHFSGGAVPFPVLHDPNAKIADAFGALKTPHAYVLSKGKVVFQGGVDDSSDAAEAKEQFLKNALVAVVAGGKPPMDKARALGCMIKRP